MSLQTYQNCANEAVLAFHGGRYREAAKKYLESFNASPEPWAENLWYIFHGFTSILKEEYFSPSQSDFDALRRFSENKAEAKLYRCEAAFVSGLLLWIAGKREESADFYREAIRHAGKASERKKKDCIRFIRHYPTRSKNRHATSRGDY